FAEAPIHFKLAVEPGAVVTVVYGLCEGSFTKPGERVLILRADGADARTVDPVKDFGANQPGIYRLTARDADHDGVIDIDVGTPGNLRERQSILNALWIFSGKVPADEDILDGRADEQAFASFPAIIQPARRVVVLMSLKNAGSAVAELQPVLRIRSNHAPVFD